MPVLYLGDGMFTRVEYYKDLLADCIDAVDQMEISEEHHGAIIAALIQSDSYNGMRKAVLQAGGIPTGTLLRGDKA
jgi:hypothetical protein